MEWTPIPSQCIWEEDIANIKNGAFINDVAH